MTPNADALDPAVSLRGPGPAYSAASFGVLGLLLTLFTPWGAIASVIAVVLGFVARSGFPETRTARLTGIIAGLSGILFAAIWLVVVLTGVASFPGDTF